MKRPNKKKFKRRASGGFFCAVYFTNDKKTVWYRKQWNPSKLVELFAKDGRPWLWIKTYLTENDYQTDRNSYYAIFDSKTPVTNFNYYQSSKLRNNE